MKLSVVAASASSLSDSEARAYSPEERGRFAGAFDRLIDSNLRLTDSVHGLVRAVYITLGLGIGMGAVGIWAVLHAH